MGGCYKLLSCLKFARLTKASDPYFTLKINPLSTKEQMNLVVLYEQQIVTKHLPFGLVVSVVVPWIRWWWLVWWWECLFARRLHPFRGVSS